MSIANNFGRLLARRVKTVSPCLVRHKYRHPETFPTLAQRLAALNVVDPDVSAPVDIGFPKPKQKSSTSRKIVISKAESQALMDAALTRTLEVDLEKLMEDWEEDTMSRAIYQSAVHYGIYKDLYQHGYFVPSVLLRVLHPISDTVANPVYRGNILTASEASSTPSVSYPSDPEDMWTLVLTNLDGHLKDPEAEYVHWFIANIKGGDISTGDELMPYLQPFPPRGTGYHRMVFVLYKQDKGRVQYDFLRNSPHKFSLKQRTFKTFDFYKAHQDVITPAGLSFYQVVWDSSVKHVFHNILNMREPVFEYYQKPKPQAPQKIYPTYQSFNRYLDKYRDPKEMKEEVLLKRLKMIEPFKEEPPMKKYPNLHIDLSLPSWYLPTVWKENNRIGRFRDLRPHSIYQQKEFDFEKDMLGRKAGEEPQTT